MVALCRFGMTTGNPHKLVEVELQQGNFNAGRFFSRVDGVRMYKNSDITMTKANSFHLMEYVVIDTR
jgi:hypothetical protein